MKRRNKDEQPSSVMEEMEERHSDDMRAQAGSDSLGAYDEIEVLQSTRTGDDVVGTNPYSDSDEIQALYSDGTRAHVERDPLTAYDEIEVLHSDGTRAHVERDPRMDEDTMEVLRSTRSSSRGSGRRHHHRSSKSKNEIVEVHSDGTRAHVERDSHTVMDDLGDYKYFRPRRSHHGKHSHKSGKSGSSKHHRHHRHKHKRMKTWKKVLLIIVSVLLVLVIALGASFLILRHQGQQELMDENVNVLVPETVHAEVMDDGDYVVYKGQTYRYNKNITSMLFLGVDKRSINGENEEGTGGQADVVVVIALDMKNKSMSMLALPRDTVTEIATYTPSGTYNGMKNEQVCLAYAYGDGKESSCENTLSSVRRIFYNIPIKTYYALDLDGIAAVNDSVGGLDVTSPETIETFVEGQSYHLLGADAERFVRARAHDRIDASLLRLNRQKEYAKSFLSAILSSVKRDITSAVRIYNESAPYSCTNLNAARVAFLASELVTGGSSVAGMYTVPGEMTYDGELARYTVNEDQFFEQFLNVYYEKM